MFEVIETSNHTLNFVYNNEINERVPLKEMGVLKTAVIHVNVPPYQLLSRICASLLPPVLTRKHQRIYVDLLGPVLAVLFLAAILQYGYHLKVTSNTGVSPIEVLVAYVSLMPILCYILCKLARSDITLVELVSVLGYSLYGHVFTLCLSLLFYRDKSNMFFFICLMVFGGLCTLRVAMILMATISKPVLRLVICSFIAIAQLLFLVFVYFTYVHRTFVYGNRG